MNEPQIEFVWPSLIDSIPILLIFVVIPGWLIWIMFKYTFLSRAKKLLLVPICLVTPFVATSLWPLILKESGIVHFTGPGDYTPPYGWYANELFGRYSAYVWVTITIIAILITQAVLKAKAAHNNSFNRDA